MSPLKMQRPNCTRLSQLLKRLRVVHTFAQKPLLSELRALHTSLCPGTSQQALGCRFPRQLNSFSCRSHRSSFLPGHPSCLGDSSQTSPVPVTSVPAEAPSHPSWAANPLLHTFQGSRCLSVFLECVFPSSYVSHWETQVLPQCECRTRDESHCVWDVNHKRSSSRSFPTEFLDCFFL